MACCLFVAKPLSEPTMTYCQLDPKAPGHTCTATCRRLPCDWKTAATNATTVRSKTAFFGCRSIGDWSATTIPKNRRPVGNRSATGGRLIANWLEIGCNWSATGRRWVGDWLSNKQFAVGAIMNKALIKCYSMAISILIMSHCLFLVYFLVRID